MVPAIRFNNVSRRFMMTAERPQTVLETAIPLARLDKE